MHVSLFTTVGAGIGAESLHGAEKVDGEAAPSKPPALATESKEIASWLSFITILAYVPLSTLDLTAVSWSTAIFTITNDLHGENRFTWMQRRFQTPIRPEDEGLAV